MKILWISHLLAYPPKGGVMQRSFNLLKKAGTENKVYLCTFNQKAWLRGDDEILEAKREMERYCRIVKVVPIPSDVLRVSWYFLVLKSFFSGRPYSVNWITSREMKEAVRTAIQEYEPDVIHCDTIGLEQYVPSRYLSSTILNHHNIESQMMLRRAQKETHPLKKVYFFWEGQKLKFYEKKVCPAVGVNVVVSDLDKERLKQLVPGARVRVVKNGVDVSYFRPMKGKTVPHSLIFAGSMDWYPNEDAMLYFIERIWPKIKGNYSDVTLTIAGRRPSQNLKEAAYSDPSIRITGFVEDIRPYIDQSEVYICPIRDGGGTKLKLLDAMAMGKPIVTTTIGAEGLEVRNGEHVLIADDPETFGKRICLLFENEDLRYGLTRNGRRFVEKHYAWEVIGKDLLTAYQMVKK